VSIVFILSQIVNVYFVYIIYVKLLVMLDISVDLDVLSLADFQTWSDNNLYCFLSLRSKSVEGTSAKLAARAFVCWEEKVAMLSMSRRSTACESI